MLTLSINHTVSLQRLSKSAAHETTSEIVITTFVRPNYLRK